MPLAFETRLSGLPPQDPNTQLFTYVLWSYCLTDSEFNCLAKLAKPIPVFRPAYMPLIPSQLNGTSMCAQKVPGACLGPDIRQLSH